MAWFYNLQSILFEFLEKGGGVVLLIAFLILIMWFFIFERIWYFQFIHPSVERDTIQEWSNVKKHKSWEGHVIRVMLISRAEQQIKNNIEFIRVCVALAPLFGLLGTIIGMIEVFHILAVTGGGDAKAMAGGVARSTIPAMAGLMAAIPASIAARWLDSNVKKKTDLLSERLTYE